MLAYYMCAFNVICITLSHVRGKSENSVHGIKRTVTKAVIRTHNDRRGRSVTCRSQQMWKRTICAIIFYLWGSRYSPWILCRAVRAGSWHQAESWHSLSHSPSMFSVQHEVSSRLPPVNNHCPHEDFGYAPNTIFYSSFFPPFTTKALPK